MKIALTRLAFIVAILFARNAAAEEQGCLGQELDEQVFGTWLLHAEGAEHIFIMSFLQDGTVIFATFFAVDGIRDEKYVRGIWSLKSRGVLRSCSFDDSGVLTNHECENFDYSREKNELSLEMDDGSKYVLIYLCEPIRYFASKVDAKAVLKGDPSSLEGAAPGGGIYGKWVFGVEDNGTVKASTLTLSRDKTFSYEFKIDGKSVSNSSGSFEYNGRQIQLQDENVDRKEVFQVKVFGDQLYYYLSPSQILPFLKIGW